MTSEEQIAKMKKAITGHKSDGRSVWIDRSRRRESDCRAEVIHADGSGFSAAAFSGRGSCDRRGVAAASWPLSAETLTKIEYNHHAGR